MEKDKTEVTTKDVVALFGCLNIFLAIVPGVGICFLVGGVVLVLCHVFLDSWLVGIPVSIGVALLSAIPAWSLSLHYMQKKLKKAEAKMEAKEREQQGIIEG